MYGETEQIKPEEDKKENKENNQNNEKNEDKKEEKNKEIQISPFYFLFGQIRVN